MVGGMKGIGKNAFLCGWYEMELRLKKDDIFRPGSNGYETHHYIRISLLASIAIITSFTSLAHK